MAKQVFVIVNCADTRRTMTGRFIEQGNYWNLAELHLRESQGMAQTDEAPERLAGTFGLADEFSGCPECGNRSYVRCGACGELSCWPGTGYFACVACGNGSMPEGRINDVRVDDFG
jgi:hypothetical protein